MKENNHKNPSPLYIMASPQGATIFMEHIMLALESKVSSQ